MAVSTIILLVIGGIFALILIAALLTRKDYSIQCEIVIHASPVTVYDYVKQLKNQDHSNKWVMADPSMKREFTGTDGTVGFIYGWNGNKQAGEGELEIKNLVEGRQVDTEIRFKRPFTGLAQVSMTTEPLPGGDTKVSWSNRSRMMYPMNLMIAMVEKMLAKDMDISLNNLKTILETRAKADAGNRPNA